MRVSKLSARGLPVALTVALSLLVGCKGGDGTEGGGFPRSQTLYLGGSQWGDPNTFNPLAESWQAAWPVGDRFNLMYEPLLNYNSVTGQIEPLLGTLVSKSNDSIVVDLNPAAKWSDGKPVTSADVKFVFDLGRKYPGAATAYVTEYIERIDVSKVGNTERLSFVVDKQKRNNPLVILDFLQAVRIAPAHVFQPLLDQNKGDLDAVKKLKIDQNPVVSGPYNLKTYSNQKIVLARRDDYWGNAALHGGRMPGPKYIIHPIYKDNNAFAIALQKGNLDASQTYIPRISLKFKKGVGTWYDQAPYFVPGSLPMLILNVTKTPLDDRNFRRAMAAAINYNNIRRLAVAGYANELKPGLIMPTNLEGKYYDEAQARAHAVTLGAASAKQILAAAGYRSVFKKSGDDSTLEYMTDKNGKRVPTLSIKAPAGWSDWEAMIKIAVKSMRDAGIDVREGFVDASLYWSAKPNGDFDILMDKPSASITPSLPWSRFQAVMSSRNWLPCGQGMNENQGRYNNPKSPNYNPKVDSLLNLIPLLTDEAALKTAYTALNNIFLDDQPAIPLVYSPEQFYEYSTNVWIGWPTAKNPTAPPQLPWVSAGINTLWNLKPNPQAK